MCHEANDWEYDKPGKYTGGTVCTCHNYSIPAGGEEEKEKRRLNKQISALATETMQQYSKHATFNQWCEIC